ncbi:MAG TPA: DMT family transporter [Usitatibacter sp.]|nr:DMT family transporter [Usitatibacter sp.]
MTAPAPRVLLLTLLAMVAFAGNSLLCRAALKGTAIDAASFTAIRIVSGAIALAIIVRLRAGNRSGGSWASGFWLFAYAAGFSYAYLSLTAGTGALLLFGAVQGTMIGYGLARGERLRPLQAAGMALALAGLGALLLPGLSAPPALGAGLMLFAGVSWGVYSLRGRGAAGDPTAVTAGNFLRAVPFAALVSAATIPWANLDPAGAALAVASGALASGVGYAIWYTALRGLAATSAATVQLSVPVIAAAGGIAFLGESLTPRLVACSVAILGGIAMTLRRQA